MRDRNERATDTVELAALRAQIDALRDGFTALGDALRDLAVLEWKNTGDGIKAAVASRRRRVAARIAEAPEKAAGTAFLAGLAVGLILRACRGRRVL